MRFFNPMPIELYINKLIASDKKKVKEIYDKWHIEQDFIIDNLVDHFYALGIETVNPYEFEEMVRNEVIYFLENSSVLKQEQEKILTRIERARVPR